MAEVRAAIEERGPGSRVVEVAVQFDGAVIEVRHVPAAGFSLGSVLEKLVPAPCAREAAARTMALSPGGPSVVESGALRIFLTPTVLPAPMPRRVAIDWEVPRYSLAVLAWVVAAMALSSLIPPELVRGDGGRTTHLPIFLTIHPGNEDGRVPDWLTRRSDGGGAGSATSPTTRERQTPAAGAHRSNAPEGVARRHTTTRRAPGPSTATTRPAPGASTPTTKAASGANTATAAPGGSGAARGAARRAGILGILSANPSAYATVTGSGSALGSGGGGLLGGLQGTEVGDVYLFGGLGLVGSGRGGGCDKDCDATIGLGNLGTIGRIGAAGTGSGYGTGSGGWGGRRAFAPDVVPGNAQARGGLDKEVIRRVVRRHVNEVRFCYERALVRDERLQGEVAIQFAILPSGQVASSSVQSTTLADPEVGWCVAQAVRRWEFHKGDGLTIVNYPFQFVRHGSGDN